MYKTWHITTVEICTEIHIPRSTSGFIYMRPEYSVEKFNFFIKYIYDVTKSLNTILTIKYTKIMRTEINFRSLYGNHKENTGKIIVII